MIKTGKVITRRFFYRTFRGEPLGFGAYMWALHRLTGLILILYLFLHLAVLGLVFSSPGAFNYIMKGFQYPWILDLEIILVWCAFFHGFNGIRIILVEFVPQLSQHLLGYSVIVLATLGTIGSVMAL